MYFYFKRQFRSTHENETGRFFKLLLRLPGKASKDQDLKVLLCLFVIFSALRSIGLKCMEHLFFFKIIGESGAELDAHLFDLLDGGDN